ncbi:hypothetical protein [Bacillus niameyensis]|nr:hypothetical protein [Bacillus niameyensis]
MKRLELTSANDLRDIAISMEIQESRDLPKKELINEKYEELIAPERTQDIYLHVLQGGR